MVQKRATKQKSNWQFLPNQLSVISSAMSSPIKVTIITEFRNTILNASKIVQMDNFIMHKLLLKVVEMKVTDVLLKIVHVAVYIKAGNKIRQL